MSEPFTLFVDLFNAALGKLKTDTGASVANPCQRPYWRPRHSQRLRRPRQVCLTAPVCMGARVCVCVRTGVCLCVCVCVWHWLFLLFISSRTHSSATLPAGLFCSAPSFQSKNWVSTNQELGPDSELTPSGQQVVRKGQRWTIGKYYLPLCAGVGRFRFRVEAQFIRISRADGLSLCLFVSNQRREPIQPINQSINRLINQPTNQLSN